MIVVVVVNPTLFSFKMCVYFAELYEKFNPCAKKQGHSRDMGPVMSDTYWTLEITLGHTR